MTTLLTKEEKINIINSHKRSLLYSQYNLEVDLIQENAKTTVDPENLATINSQIAESQKQIDALTAEATRLTNLTEAQEKMADNTQKLELVITALQQRIGDLVSNYETQIAILRADVTQLVKEKEAKDGAIQEYSDSLNNLTN